MKVNFWYVLSILSILITTSCKTAYVPNTINTPLLQNAGEVRLSVDQGVNAQAALAVTNHIGIIANSMFIPTQKNKNDNDVKVSEGKGYMLEAGIGYFKAKPMDNLGSKLVMELYGGGGWGKVTWDNIEQSKKYTNTATRLFFQPGIGWSSRFIEVALTPRLSALSFNDPTGNYTVDELKKENLPYSDSPMFVFFEPAITVRGGYKWIKAQVQLGRSFKLGKQELDYKNSIFNIGIILDLNNNSYK